MCSMIRPSTRHHVWRLDAEGARASLRGMPPARSTKGRTDWQAAVRELVSAEAPKLTTYHCDDIARQTESENAFYAEHDFPTLMRDVR